MHGTWSVEDNTSRILTKKIVLSMLVDSWDDIRCLEPNIAAIRATKESNHLHNALDSPVETSRVDFILLISYEVLRISTFYLVDLTNFHRGSPTIILNI